MLKLFLALLLSSFSGTSLDKKDDDSEPNKIGEAIDRIKTAIKYHKYRNFIFIVLSFGYCLSNMQIYFVYFSWVKAIIRRFLRFIFELVRGCIVGIFYSAKNTKTQNSNTVPVSIEDEEPPASLADTLNEISMVGKHFKIFKPFYYLSNSNCTSLKQNLAKITIAYASEQNYNLIINSNDCGSIKVKSRIFFGAHVDGN